MKILEIGSCCASIPQLYSNILNTTHVSFFSHKYLQNAEKEFNFGTKYSKYWGMGLIGRILKIKTFWDVINSFDFLHFHYNTYFPFYIDTKLYKNKVIGIHYHGDDIRLSPWKQKFTNNFDFIFLATPDLLKFFPKKGIWLPSPVLELPYIGVKDTSFRKIVIGHMTGDLSNKRTRKGTEIILKRIKEIKNFEQYFELRIITGFEHPKAVEALMDVDIFIDQITSYGAYGISAVEAMYLGKPVISSFNSEYYEKCPMIPVQTDGANLGDILMDLKKAENEMKEVGKKGRAYAIEFHSPRNAVDRFLKIISS